MGLLAPCQFGKPLVMIRRPRVEKLRWQWPVFSAPQAVDVLDLGPIGLRVEGLA